MQICDFGFARDWEGDDNMLTSIGTPVYMVRHKPNSTLEGQAPGCQHGYDEMMRLVYDSWPCAMCVCNPVDGYNQTNSE